jgi:ABC-type lipoprotein release transport system permease subunit
MKSAWPLFLAWKQLFPSQKKVSFFSLLAIVGVALGVNVMIVVVAFMQGFQQKFRSDIIDAQGHARAVPLKKQVDWQKDIKKISLHAEVEKVSPYIQGHLLLQNRDYHAVPFSMGIDPSESDGVLPLNQFLHKGFIPIQGYDSRDVTPVPTTDLLDDDVVFITQQVANRLGVRAATVLLFDDQNVSSEKGKVLVEQLDPYVESDEWKIEFIEEDKFNIRNHQGSIDINCTFNQPMEDLGWGYPKFKLVEGNKPFSKGDQFRFQIFRSSTIEIYSPSMIEKVKSDEMTPPREVRVGGIFQVPWQGFHTDALIGTDRFMEDMRGEENACDGFFIKFQTDYLHNENRLGELCARLEGELEGDWSIIPWFIENAWFFDLLKFEEYLMVLIMIPIGLVAAFAIAIALMTTVLRKIREIGLLIAMGGTRFSVGMIFCMQGFIIGSLGAFLGCGMALTFIRYRDSLMGFIVNRIAGEDGQAGVTQFYDFYSLDVSYPWESEQSMMTFLTFILFAIGVSTLAGLLPAWRAARMNPAEALRSE